MFRKIKVPSENILVFFLPQTNFIWKTLLKRTTEAVLCQFWRQCGVNKIPQARTSNALCIWCIVWCILITVKPLSSLVSLMFTFCLYTLPPHICSYLPIDLRFGPSGSWKPGDWQACASSPQDDTHPPLPLPGWQMGFLCRSTPSSSPSPLRLVSRGEEE